MRMSVSFIVIFIAIQTYIFKGMKMLSILSGMYLKNDAYSKNLIKIHHAIIAIR